MTDVKQIIYALRRSILALEGQAEKLHTAGDYGAEFPAEDAERLREAVELLAAQPAPVPKFDRTTALVLMQAAAMSGDPGAINLAAQLAGAAPCADCGYVNFKCRCQPFVPDDVERYSDGFKAGVIAATAHVPAVLPPREDPDCHYFAPKGNVCNKCGRVHRGITAPGVKS